MQTANEIRRTFIAFFERNGHRPVDSGPLVPLNDPTLLFTNSGMVQFKNVFTGQERRDYRRAATSQKCLRAGGKHNDLENVGYTARHHTFFEMLGNFSFGDYFKELAIELAWGLITREYGLPEEKLLVTVFSEDDDAAALWKRIAGLSDDRIVRIPTSDNFWTMGDAGPCGPCSEIFYDHGPDIPGGPPGGPDQDGDRFIEIWNLVFMQFEQVTRERRIDLPRPSIDTGMGLERLAAVLQGKHDNYDIDLMRALIDASAEATGVDPAGPQGVSHRVIADHLRASAFLIADGVLPSNEGRGYVLRRIMRRAMRHAHKLGAAEPLLHRLAPALVGQMGQAFPELGRAQALIAETLKLEEARFRATLDRGMHLLDAETDKLGDGGALPGGIAFTLYDTYGFPLDLTRDILRSQGKTVDEDGFNAAMQEQRAKARAAWAGSGDASTERRWFDLRERFGATEFLGHESVAAEGQVLAIVSDGEEVDSVAAGAKATIVVNQTPFYGESGGQMGDVGEMRTGGGGVFQVGDTQKQLGDLHLHIGQVASGRIGVGDAVELLVDAERRDKLRANHSATHLVHEALRRVLGDRVTQKGSLAAPDRLRFDISHPRPVSPQELTAVEADVNRRIRVNAEVETRYMTPAEAVAGGALALFGEKYGDEVRVVSIGGDAPEKGEGSAYSTELCGGTHVRRTGDIALFKIVSESAVSSGVRRIEALTGQTALDRVNDREDRAVRAAAALKTTVDDLPDRVASLVEERRRLERELAEARKALALGGNGRAEPSAGDVAEEVGGVRFAARILSDVPAKELKGMADGLKQRIGSGVVAVIAVNEGKASLVVGVTDDLADRLNAVDLVRIGGEAIGGKGGGGRPDMAQAGGPGGDKADAAVKAIADALADRAHAAA